MKIHLPQAILRTLSAAAVFVSTPLAVTVATGSFIAGTASAAIEVKKEGGDFVLSYQDGNFVANEAYKDTVWGSSTKGSTDNAYIITLGGNVLNALRTNKGFAVELNVPAAPMGDTAIVSFGNNTFPNFSLLVEEVGRKKTIVRFLNANYGTGEDDYNDTTFSVDDKGTANLAVAWTETALSGTVSSIGSDGIVSQSSVSCDLPTSGSMNEITSVTLNSAYVSKFTVKIDESYKVTCGTVTRTYNSLLPNQLGNADAIVLNDGRIYEVLNGTNQDAVKGADVYIGGGAQLKIKSDENAGSAINVAGDKTIFIDSTGTGTTHDLVLSSTNDSLAGVNLGNVTLVGATSTIALSGGAGDGKGKITLLGSIKEEDQEQIPGGRTLIITSADEQSQSGLTLGKSGTKSGSINVGTLELQNASIYLDGDDKGTVTAGAGAVTVGKNGTETVLSNVKMSGSGIESASPTKGKGTVSYADVTVKGTVSNLAIDHSTIKLNGTGSVSGGGAASPAVSTLAEGDGSTSSSIIDTDIDSSTITLTDGTSIGKGTKVSNSDITVEANANATVSGDLQNDLIKLKNACSLTVQDAVLGSGTRFEAADGETPTKVEVTNSTVVLGQNDIKLSETKVLTPPDNKRGVEIFSNKLANVTSVSGIKLSFTRDLIEYLEDQLGGTKGSLHYVKINFTDMKLSGAPKEGWLSGLAGELPADSDVPITYSTVPSTGDLVTGIVIELGPSVVPLPEPTSATLSLLALAALAARRRRRKC